MQKPSSRRRVWRFTSLILLLLPAALGVDGRVDAAAALTGLAVFDTAGQQPRPAPAPAAAATTEKGERIVVSFSDPTRPGTLRIGLVTGGMSIRGYDGKDVIVEPRLREDDEDRGSRTDRGGLRRIPNTASGLTVEEENNVMRIATSLANRSVDINIQVPRRTSLKLSTVNDGDIRVEGVEGELEVDNTNGGVELVNVSGTVVAHALNDDVKVTLTKADAKPMSFSSLNGNLDVTLPADIKCNVRLETGQGDIYSDFDIDMVPSQAQQTIEDNRAKGGKFKVKVEKAMVGRINGGGAEVKFKTFNGDIHIRRAK